MQWSFFEKHFPEGHGGSYEAVQIRLGTRIIDGPFYSGTTEKPLATFTIAYPGRPDGYLTRKFTDIEARLVSPF